MPHVASPIRVAILESGPLQAPPLRSPPAARARSPAVAARSPAVRLPLRSPARGPLKRKATTPQQHIRPAVEQSPVSPLQSPKIRKLRREDCVSPGITPVKSPHESPPDRSSAASSPSTPPYMPASPQLESIDDTSASDDQVSLNYFQTHTAAVSLMSLKKRQHKIIIDSGASTCGTGIKSQLQSQLRPTSLTVSAAFGETAQPTEMGDLPPTCYPPSSSIRWQTLHCCQCLKPIARTFAGSLSP